MGSLSLLVTKKNCSFLYMLKMLEIFKFLKILKFFNIMQFKQKHNGIEYNVTFFASDKKNLSQVVDQGITFPTRGPPILYLLRFLRSSKKIMILKIMSLSLLVTKKNC